MNNKKSHKHIIIFSIMSMCVGASISAGPAYHFARWKFKEIKGIVIWQAWQNSSKSAMDDMTPAVWLKIPDAGINTLVISTPDKENLLKYPCILPVRTHSLHEGIDLIMAHRDMHFQKLERIQINDIILIEQRNKKVTRYKVVETEILASEKAAERLREKSGEHWLVLMTCYPFKYIGPAPKRFIVWAKPTTKSKNNEHQT